MKVLVVDDDPDMLKVLGLLMKVNGITALTATGGVEGLERARADKPDVILLDIMMPDLDGYEVIKELRSDGSTRGIPVIFVTARMEKEYREKAQALGADGYITKPYERSVLIEMIGRVAGSRNALEAGGLHPQAQERQASI
jgi:CheY-like chemotaxis protein